MPLFAYQARDKSGERTSGTREAPDKQAALAALRDQGYFVTHLAPADARTRRERPPAETPSRAPENAGAASARPAESVSDPVSRPAAAPARTATTPAGATAPALPRNLWLSASSKELSLFYRQMHSMLNAGTSVGAALNTMAVHGANAAIRRAAGEMSKATTQGAPLNESMRAYPSLFDPLALGMIAAGEGGGFLDRTFSRLSIYAERDYELQQTIKRESWYPKLLLFCSILIPSVVPAVLASIAGRNWLPVWLATVCPPFAFICAIWLVWKFGRKLSPVAFLYQPLEQGVDWLKLRIPVVSKTVRALAAAKFCRAMAALYSAGMGAHRILDVAAGACGNAAMAEGVRRVIPRIERGEGLTDSLESTGYFPGVAIQMMRTGEMSGQLDTQLDKVADFMEQDAETAIRQAVKAFGILIFLFMAAYIGYVAVNMLGGYIGFVTDLTDAGG